MKKVIIFIVALLMVAPCATVAADKTLEKALKKEYKEKKKEYKKRIGKSLVHQELWM